MEKSLRYSYKGGSINCLIEEDIVGFYLIIYDNKNPDKSVADYLFDSVDDAFQAAKEKFGILKTQWLLLLDEEIFP